MTPNLMDHLNVRQLSLKLIIDQINIKLLESYTGDLLRKTGTMPVVEQAFNKIETYSMISYRLAHDCQ